MPTLEDLADRVERLLLRHTELKRTHALLEQQVAALGNERDSLRSRLNAARSRIDALLDRLPTEASAAAPVSASDLGSTPISEEREGHPAP
jgi:cell division protein ZapB